MSGQSHVGLAGLAIVKSLGAGLMLESPHPPLPRTHEDGFVVFWQSIRSCGGNLSGQSHVDLAGLALVETLGAGLMLESPPPPPPPPDI